MAITNNDIDNRMNFHSISHEQSDAVDELRELLIGATKDAIALVPEGREKSLMVTHLEEALMWGVKGIVIPASS